MQALCVATLKGGCLYRLPYIAKLSYQGDGHLHADKFPIGNLGIRQEKDDSYRIIATETYEFNELDVIEIDGEWTINGEYLIGSTHIVENDTLVPLLDDKTRNAMSICVERYITTRPASSI